MAYIWISPGTTFCADTPDNWAEFYRLKADLLANPGRSRTLHAQIAKENKRLRKLSTFLPGYEPDR